MLGLIFAYAEEKAEIHGDAGTIGAAFLKLEPGCRPVGMGGAFVGLANDVNALFWNPAGLVSIQKSELSAMQNFSFGGVNNVTAGYARRLGKLTLGVSLQGVFAEIERRSGPSEDPEETFYSGGVAVGIAGGYELMRWISVGGVAKYIYQNYDQDETNGLAVDVGGMIRMLDGKVSAGVTLQNLGWVEGEPESEGKLPTSLRAGGAISLDKGKLNLSAEANIPFYGDPSVRVGLERWVHQVLALRVGYNLGFKSAAENPASGLTAGVGLKAYGTKPLENVNFQFDYAYIPDRRFGDSHRISFITRF
jgi:hypothetical protein